MARGGDDGPQTWWERYGHRIEPQGEVAVQAPAARVGRQDGAGRAASVVSGPVEDKPRRVAPRQAGSAELTDDMIVRGRAERPDMGWRKLVLQASGGLINPGPSEAEKEYRSRLHRIRRPLTESHRIAVTSIKGGVGKTTVTTCLGLVLAENRGDRCIVLDANPDAGTLADRLTGESTVTVRELLQDIERIASWADVTRYTSLAGRLQVLASEQDPAAGEAFSRVEYEDVSRLLARFFNIVITDSGTGLVHSAMEGTLNLADSLIVVGAPTVDGASRASKTLDWLHAHGHAALAGKAIMVLSCDRTSSEIDLERIREHFEARCRAVVEIPHDPHLATGGRIDLSRLRRRTRDAFVELAALIADGFEVVRPGGERSRGRAPRPATGAVRAAEPRPVPARVAEARSAVPPAPSV
ncbi:MAG TPA: MinD/ParA family protein [Pseudonocardia sp.]|nr:MinD/ParA family protein [Pseudonocardia sp.]